MRVAVVGAGTMGVRVALRCARYGLDTVLVARNEGRASAALAPAAAESGDEAHVAAVRVTADFGMLAGAALVYEAVPEDLARKQELLGEIESYVGDHVPLVSGTSTLLPDQLGFYLEFPQRVFVAHFVHPVTLVALAEVAESRDADAAARDTFEAWLTLTRLDALRLATPLPGYIVNRLQFALLREALHIVERGGATAEQVDVVMRFGLGPRWTATGPVESIALGGAATFADVARVMVPQLDARREIPLLEPGALDVPAPRPEAARRARRAAYRAAVEVDRERRS
jgi:3-hydroxybutyryl-CoA dehydrogenase